MFGLFSSFRMWMYIGFALAILGLVLGAKYYYDTTQKRLAQYAANQAKLELVIQNQKATISAIKQNEIELQSRLNDLTIGLQQAETEVNKLQQILQKHNLTYLALKKPELIERRINDATHQVFLDFERITGAQ